MPGPELNIGGNPHRTGLKFSNLLYPSSDVVGHIFVYGSREQERTVLYRGSLTPLFNGVDNTIEYNTDSTLKYARG